MLAELFVNKPKFPVLRFMQ